MPYQEMIDLNLSYNVDLLISRTKGTSCLIKKAPLFQYQSLDSLKTLKNRKIVHNDIKPQNYLVKFKDDGKNLLNIEIVLTDFGLVDSIGGTPIFASPECLADFKRKQKSDIFSLGRVFLFLLLSKEQFLELLFIPIIEAKQAITNEINEHPLLKLISNMMKLKDRIDIDEIDYQLNTQNKNHTSHWDIIERISKLVNQSVDEWTSNYIANLKHFS